MVHRSATLAGLLVLAIAAPAQAVESFVTQFEKVYGSAANQAAVEVIQSADGGFLAVGGEGTRGLVVKTDSNGEVEWQQYYDALPSAMGFSGAVQTPDGGYVLSGSVNPSPRVGSLGSRDPQLIKIDAGGVEQWRTITGGPGDERFYEIALGLDGSIVGTGGTSSDFPGKDPTSDGAYVVKVSGAGAILSEVAFDQIGGTENWEEGYHLVTTPDGGFLVTGMAYAPDRWFLLRLDSGLNKLWGAFYGTAAIQTIAKTSSGGFVAAGIDLVTSEAVLVQLDLDPDDLTGPVLIRPGFPKYYVRPGPHIYTIFYGAEGTADGGVIAAGYYFLLTDPDDPLSEISRTWVVRTDAAGDVEREDIYAQGGARGGVIATSDGGYLAAGGAINYPGGAGGVDFYLLKLIDVLNPGTVSGTVWFDEDATCSLTGGDVGATWRLVRLVDDATDAAFLAMSGTDGTYSAALPPGDYTATLAASPVSEEPETCGVTGKSYAVPVASDSVQSGKDFFGGCKCAVAQSLTGGAVPPVYDCLGGVSSTPCPGYPWEICYGVTNLCNPLLQNPGGGGNFVRTCVNLPAGTTYAGPATITTSNCGGSGAWHLQSTSPPGQVCFELDNNNNFKPGCHADLCFNVNVLPAFTGGTVTAQFATNQCTGAAAIPPAAPLTYGSECSCDPNAMHVTPEGCGPEGSITGQELTYRIDFQNLGAGPAHDVVLTDALDSDLDVSTLRLLEASHTITAFQVSDQGELVVRFDDIELPAEVFDAEGSQGHVTFAISPLEPYVDGTVVENTASIVFDANEPVVTNTVTSTLYHGDPVPVADFTATPSGDSVDFAYTGGTSGVTLAWDFGATATPRTSTDMNPTGIEYPGPGQTAALLVATKAGCSSETVQSVDVPCDGFWTTTAFEAPMGVRRHRVGSRIRLKLGLSYEGAAVTTQARLDEILNTDFARTPAGDCWPRVRVLTADRSEELALAPSMFPGMPANPDGCLRFNRKGKLSARVKLASPLFERGAAYVVELQNYTCRLAPPNGVLETRP